MQRRSVGNKSPTSLGSVGDILTVKFKKFYRRHFAEKLAHCRRGFYAASVKLPRALGEATRIARSWASGNCAREDIKRPRLTSSHSLLQDVDLEFSVCQFVLVYPLAPTVVIMESEPLFSTQEEEAHAAQMEELTSSHEEAIDSDSTQMSSSSRKPARGKGKGRRGVKRPTPTQLEEEDDEASLVITTLHRERLGKLTDEQEEEAMEWFREHAELYAKKSPKYMDTAHKTRLYEVQAQKMGIQCK